jgi:SAM-dependent methyltransferase
MMNALATRTLEGIEGEGVTAVDASGFAASVAVELEVPVTWLPSSLDGDRHRQMFARLCCALAKKPLTIKMSPVSHGMHHIPRTAPEGGMVLSYHSCGDGDNIWRIKETPIADWYSFDQNGFSGWSSLARFPERHAAAIEAMDVQASLSYTAHIRTTLRQHNKSKFQQSNEPFSMNRPYVYLPLQIIDDPVSQFYRMDALAVLQRAAELADSTGIPLVVKRHPLCRSKTIADALHNIGERFRNVVISKASVHQHLDGCSAVLVANSGVGLEALMYLKPVFSFGASEYELATIPISTLDEVEKAFAPAMPDVRARCAQFIKYYLEECCFSILDPASVDRCIDRALKACGQTAALGNPLHEQRDMAETYGQMEQLKRALATAKSEKNHLNMLLQQATDVVKKIETLRQDGAASPAAVPLAQVQAAADMRLKAATDSAISLHKAGLAASIGSTVANMLVCDAYNQYAELAALALKAPENAPAVYAGILKSEYASGTDPKKRGRNITADAYQKLHDHDRGYQNNNWLVEHCDVITAARPNTIVEVGCGNGQFLKRAAPQVAQVIGIDWARSPFLSNLPANVEFKTVNVLEDDVPSGDVCCSADVLEHFVPESLPDLLRKLHQAARFNYHVIACYDDGHSHCAVLHPGQWLALFQTISPDYRLVATIARPMRPQHIACVITNIPSAKDHFPKLGHIMGNWVTDTGQRIAFRNDFTLRINGKSVANWFQTASGTAAIQWTENQMLDTAHLQADGDTLVVSTHKGDTFRIRRER